jgi:hypothetical protein
MELAPSNVPVRTEPVYEREIAGGCGSRLPLLRQASIMTLKHALLLLLCCAEFWIIQRNVREWDGRL